MKLFFPLLTISLIFSVMQYPCSTISASAQQHHSFASARFLSLEQSALFPVAANASEYCYFHSLHSPKNTGAYLVTLSGASSVSVSAYDDQGSTICLTVKKNRDAIWTGLLNSTSDSKRFFLVLHNHSTQDVSIHLSIQSYISTSPNYASPTENTKTPAKKSQQKSRKKPLAKTKCPAKSSPQDSRRKPLAKTKCPAKSSPQDSRRKPLAKTKCPAKSSPQDSRRKPLAKTKCPAKSSPQDSRRKNLVPTKQPSKNSSQNSRRIPLTPTKHPPKNSRNDSSMKSKKSSPYGSRSFPAARPSHNNFPQTGNGKSTTPMPVTPPTASDNIPQETTIPENKNNHFPTGPLHSNHLSDNHNTHTPSKSNAMLSSHFFRITVGYSISVFRLLPLNLTSREITIKTTTPDIISIQDNIIYARKPGLAVLQISLKGSTTSCTLYLQEAHL